MIANYHTHTIRCRHAEGAEIEYVQAAIDGGLKILGFSDHTPQFFPGEYYSTMRMRPEELDDYVQTIRRLQVEYADRLQILLGLEVEYYPDIFPKLLDTLRGVGIEYMILGQHWNNNEYDSIYNGKPTEDVAKLERYCDQVIEAMQTGLFTYLAHPDLIKFVGSEQVYRQHMRRLCKAAKQYDMPLELNMLGLREGRIYPNPVFWQIAGEEGCSVVIGSDAHAPKHVRNPREEEAALEMVNTYGLTLLQTVPIKTI